MNAGPKPPKAQPETKKTKFSLRDSGTHETRSPEVEPPRYSANGALDELLTEVREDLDRCRMVKSSVHSSPMEQQSVKLELEELCKPRIWKKAQQITRLNGNNPIDDINHEIWEVFPSP